MEIPKHIAVIMDGNGRWAKEHGLARNVGHARGSKNVERVCEAAWNMGVEYLTVYAFSTENWKRPKAEVEALMKLLRNYMKSSIKKAKKNNMRIRIIGDLSPLEEDLQDSILELIEATKDHTGLNFTIAINYGSRDEILRGIRSITEDCLTGKVTPAKIDEELFSSYLDTRDLPDPELLIRTSGEYRLSNYLLWQLAYTEFYFASVHWPDFTKEELELAIKYYNQRERRYGGLQGEEDV
jgi:undecaprenyl diphosphate synthase